MKRVTNMPTATTSIMITSWMNTSQFCTLTASMALPRIRGVRVLRYEHKSRKIAPGK